MGWSGGGTIPLLACVVFIVHGAAASDSWVSLGVKDASSYLATRLNGSGRVMGSMLYTYDFINDAPQHRQLRRALGSLLTYLAPYLPVDIVVFTHVRPNQREVNLLNAASIHFAPIDSRWLRPASDQRPQSSWPMSYRMMGHWRLHQPFMTARVLNFDYVMHLDSDAYMLRPLQLKRPADVKGTHGSIMEYLRRENILMAQTIHNSGVDIVDVTQGLPELALYFIVTNSITPATLYNYCTPANASGVHTVKPPFSDGYNRFSIGGAFSFINLDFWFSPLVQDFVTLCIRTGGHIRFRWNEQAVQTMVWQLFVPTQQFAWFNFTFGHKDPNNHILFDIENNPACKHKLGC